VTDSACVPLVSCPQCGARVPAVDGPTHPYYGAAPGCWALYREVLARAFGDYRFARLQRLTADAYAAPHPGQADDRRAVQSVAVHLIGLALSLAPTLAPGRSLAPLLQAAANGSAMYRWLPLLADLGAVTVADVHAAVPSVALAQALSTTDEARGDRADKGAGDGAGQDARAHLAAVQRWGESVWPAWAPHHAEVRRWTAALLDAPTQSLRRR